MESNVEKVMLESTNTRKVGEDKRRLECHLSGPELIVRGDELATQVKNLAEAEKREAERRKEAKDSITAIEMEVTALAKTVKDKLEVREVLVVFDMVST